MLNGVRGNIIFQTFRAGKSDHYEFGGIRSYGQGPFVKSHFSPFCFEMSLILSDPKNVGIDLFWPSEVAIL